MLYSIYRVQIHYLVLHISRRLHMSDDKYKHFLLKFGFWAAITAIVCVFFRYIFSYTLPFLIALAVASLLQPVVRFLGAKLKIRSGIAGVVIVIFSCLILAGLVLLISNMIIVGIIDLITALPHIFSDSVEPALSELGESLKAMLARFSDSAVSIVNDSMPEIITSISSAVTDFSVNVVTWASGVAVSVPGALLSTVICIIASLFMTVDYEKMIGFFKRILPEKAVSIFGAAARSLKTILGNYAKSYFLIMIITFAEIAVGLLIIGERRAVLIALLVAIFDILPIVGSGLILLPWTIITFIQGDISRGIGLAILYIVVVVARQIFEPKIVGKRVGLHPLITLFCMWMGVRLLGGFGLFGFPITVLIIKRLMESGVIGKRIVNPETSADNQ